MEKKDYRFKFVCNEFELEVCGDQKFVEQTLNRFEKKVMIKLRELAASQERAGEKKTEDKPQPGLKQPQETRAKPPDDKKTEHRRRRGRRSRKRRHPPKTGATAIEAQKAQADKDEGPAEAEAASLRTDSGKLRQDIERQKPKTHHDRIMIFAHHLENRPGAKNFTPGELKSCYEHIKEAPPVNIQQVLNHATRSGFLVTERKGPNARYRLTAKAKKYINDGLRLL